MKKNSFSLSIKSLNSNSFYTYINFIQKLLCKLNIVFTQISLPTNKKRITLLKSPFVNKRAREQFEIKFYKSIIRIKGSLDLLTLKMFLINKPSTIQFKVKNS